MPEIEAAKTFWEWFMCNQNVYLNFKNITDDRREVWLDKLFRELKKYSKELGISLNLDSESRAELAITAKGNADYFEDVMFLTKHAPVTDKWNFINFISKIEIPGGFIYEDIFLYPDDIYFSARKNSKRSGLLDLCLYIRASKATMQSKELNNAVKMLLLYLVGETELAACIGSFSVRHLSAGPAKKTLYRLRKLPQYLSTRNTLKALFPALDD